MTTSKNKGIDCWKTRIWAYDIHPMESMVIDGEIIYNLNHYESINILSTLQKSVTIEADPFLFVKNGILYLFYESKNLGKNGVIKVATTQDLKTWTDPVIVLTEKCHLSYPFVFEDSGDVYMIPETGALKSIRLYRSSVSDLTNWEYVRTLVEEDEDTSDAEISFCDSSILKIDGLYYLFTTIVRNKTNELHIYYSDNLDSPFIKHPANPIIRSNKYGRCAGSIIKHNGKMYRVSQECSNSYGENVCVSEILFLSPNEYEEKVLTDCLFDRKNPYYKDGAHQLNIVRFQNKYVVATDAKGYRKLLVQRILSKMLN